MDARISEEEIRTSIYSFGRRKTPGSDGLPIELYICFVNIFAKILKKVFEKCFENGHLTDTMKYGIISQLHKKGDKTKRENWRPLTMLNVDFKILTKILTLRLKKIAHLLIHSDQGRSQLFDPGMYT